jgi:hypothetical protein
MNSADKAGFLLEIINYAPHRTDIPPIRGQNTASFKINPIILKKSDYPYEGK